VPKDLPKPSDGEQQRLLEFIMSQLIRTRILPEAPPFPPAESADEHGCVALGARLTPDMVLNAYRRGIFPMAEANGAVGWWSPDPRTIVDLDRFHVSRRLARTVRQGRFKVLVDTAWPEVVSACGDREDTWISPEIEDVYGQLHRDGHVHTVEAWHKGELAGGLYGVSIGGAFMAESMFHRVRDASKVAVVALVERLRARGFRLLDIQYETKATSVFRPLKIPRADYLERLAKAVALNRSFIDE
jgi:leucyl/phenylalanyl-tRNA--protein transferase